MAKYPTFLHDIELHKMSLAMASHIDDQQSTIKTIDDNASLANEKALLLTIQTAKMTQRTKGVYADKFSFPHLTHPYRCI